MKVNKIMLAVIISASIALVSCKAKDSDIKAKVEEALKAEKMMTNPAADVKDGVVTISGECKDNECKAHCEKMVADIKGVKSVVNNCSLALPVVVEAPPASMTTVLDAATQQKVKDGLKDIKGVTVEFSSDKAVISGEVTKADRMKIMQMLASAKVLSDVSKLMDKK